MKLGKNQRCPIHRRTDCCGRRPPVPKDQDLEKLIKRYGVTTFPDGREKCTQAVLRKRKDILLAKPDAACAACGETFDDYREVELAHKKSKGMGGSKRDDRWPNLCLMHKSENREQGSRSLGDYLTWRILNDLPVPADAHKEIEQIHGLEA